MRLIGLPCCFFLKYWSFLRKMRLIGIFFLLFVKLFICFWWIQILCLPLHRIYIIVRTMLICEDANP